MRRRPLFRAFGVGAVLGAALVCAPAPARGQGSTCTLNARNSLTQGNLTFVSGPLRINCNNGVRVRADSAVNIKSQSEWYLIGHVTYADTSKEMNADWVHYFSNRRYLQGRGNVRVRDEGSGSTVSGERLEYFRASSEQQQARVVVEGGRPHAELHGKSSAGARPAAPDTMLGRAARDTSLAAMPPDSAAPIPSAGPVVTPPDTAPPTLVDADRIELPGDNAFHATGDVKITRGELHGSGREVTYDRAAGNLDLTGEAHLAQDTYDLSGSRILGRLGADERIERVDALGKARLESDQARVEAPLVRIFFSDGAVQRLVALGARRVPAEVSAEDSATQAVARSEGIRLVADSVDALASRQSVDSIYAIGRAYGEQLSDTVRADLPDLLASDWARGDTIRAYFAPASDTTRADPSGAVAAETGAEAPDSARAVLERLVVVGQEDEPAQSVYRTREEGETAAARPSINYMVAQSITLRLEHGEVQRVEALGSVRGVHLRPTDTAPTDTTNAPPAPVTGRGHAPAASRERGAS